MAKKEKSRLWLTKQIKKLQSQLDQQTEETQEEVTEVALEDTVGTDRYPDVYTMWYPNELSNFVQSDSQITFHCINGFSLKIILLSEDIIRFRYSRTGQYASDFSYAIDPNFPSPETPYILENKKNKILIQTAKLTVEVSKQRLNIIIKDLKGNIICEDDKGYEAKSTILKGITQVKISKKAATQESYFGLGDKSGKLNMRGSKYQNWCTDAFGFGENSDPLYRAIPFYFGLRKGIGYGIFFDNTYRTYFDFDTEEKGTTAFWAEGGEVDYYFFYGPSLLSVAEKYMTLTGKPELPPLWSLGFHQCRWSYFPERRVREVAAEFRKRQIPCDAIYLDIDYMDGYRCFTWNERHFPKPSKMIADLEKEGFQTVVMIDPGIREDMDYFVYKEGVENDYFCKRTNGDIMHGPVWPPNCGFPDFTHADVRDWWGQLYQTLYTQDGVSGFWNDMNEPALFKVNHYTFPDEVLHHHEGNLTNHAKAHNVYGLQMTRATTDGLKKLKPEKRPFLVTRATYAGGQRFAAVWTGDNLSTWEHLQIGNRQCQRLSASGFSFVGTDIGGFAGYPDGELLVRWLQLGIFHPFFRIHSMGNNDDGSAEADAEKVKERDAVNRLDQEPWSFGNNFTPSAKAAIELRYKLLPYLYTAFWQYVQKGTPMIRSLVFCDQNDKNCIDAEVEFMFGDHLLVAPVTAPTIKKVSVYLPKGEWLDYWTGEQYTGGQHIKYSIANLEKFPLFVRAGSIIPHYPVMQYTKEKKVEELTLKVYFTQETHNSMLYEDNGEGYEHLGGKYSLRQYKVTQRKGIFHIEQYKEGNLTSEYKSIKIELYGFPDRPKKIIVDNSNLAYKFKKNYIQFVVPSNFKQLEIE